MKCFYDSRQALHYPASFLVNGVREANPESPDRTALLLDGAKKAGLQITAPTDHGLGPIASVHTPEYLHFLKNAYKRWSRMEGAASEVTPNIHPTTRGGTYPASVVAQAGYHMADASCPIAKDTWESALWSAHSAVSAATHVLDGGRVAYALCRPPGHHAGSDIAGGFCYLNNTAIAAQHLRRGHDRVAILDVDLHHGNGTQMIFYHRGDVLTISLHADPMRFYPFFWGHSNERGEGAGLGYNLNLPLPRKSGDEAFLAALSTALDRLESFEPSAVVIALGLDGYEGDPIAGLSISTKGFHAIGKAIAKRVTQPTVIVQEGGYPCAELGDNLASFMAGYGV